MRRAGEALHPLGPFPDREQRPSAHQVKRPGTGDCPSISLKMIGSLSAYVREFNRQIEDLSLKVTYESALGDELEFTIIRDGQELTIAVMLDGSAADIVDKAE